VSDTGASTGSAALADRVAARATGVGVGLVVFTVLWLVGNRLTSLLWDPPTGPVVAMAGALVTGGVMGWLVGARLVRSVSADSAATVERH